MSRKFLDITELYNHRMVFSQRVKIDNKKEIGEANNFILSEYFSFNKITAKGNVRGKFIRRGDGLDNVACESQILWLNGMTIKKIIFIGCCFWGCYKENFTVECTDGTVEYAKAYFSDITCPSERACEFSFKTEGVLYKDGCRYFCDLKLKRGGGYMYYYPTEFSCAKQVEKIIFPENILMHIFGITIEN